MWKKINLIFLLILLIGCTREVIKEVPTIIEVDKYPILKIADCYGMLTVSTMGNLTEQYATKDAEYKSEYNLTQFFYRPMVCSYEYNWSSPNCKAYADSLAVYPNCSIYYLDTKILYRE